MFPLDPVENIQLQPTPVLLPGKSHGRRSLVAAVRGVAESQTQLSNFTFTFHFHAFEKEMATHSSEKENEIVALKLNIQKTKITASGPITSWQIDGETVETVRDYWALKSLQMVTAAIKLKDVCSLE